jgi:predicted GH43/DUF377 family glycosyl hydrolase
MKWHKKGLVFVPSGELWWAKEYAHLPTPIRLSENVIRVYFAGLDENRYGRIGYVDLAAGDPQKVLMVAPEPVLDIGDMGTFEDCGVVPSCLIERNGEWLLYYHGFQRTERVPYLIFTGLAVGEPGNGKFRRWSRTPILDRCPAEPFLRGAPCVIAEMGILRMWYVSCLRWSKTNSRLHYNNVIRHATSSDGVHWRTDDAICLEPELPDEFSVGRPAVVRDPSGYRMWFSARSHSKLYTMGYAHSRDGLQWQRADDQVGINKSPSGWDSELICYAGLIQIQNRWHMFYNGNGHGASGFGYALGEE